MDMYIIIGLLAVCALSCVVMAFPALRKHVTFWNLAVLIWLAVTYALWPEIVAHVEYLVTEKWS